MASILRFRKLCYVEPVKCYSLGFQSLEAVNDGKKGGLSVTKVENLVEQKQKRKINKQCGEWRCIGYCYWTIGYLCTTWWLLCFSYHSLPCTLPGFQLPESPGMRLKSKGVTALHPVVLVPGIVTGGLELWEGKPCAEGLFKKRLWGGPFAEILKRPLCWLEHLSLQNETGLDPPGIRVRSVPGFVAADNSAPGNFVWIVLIENLAKIGYEGKNMYMASYGWRLSFQNRGDSSFYKCSLDRKMQDRDQALSRLKSKIELIYATNGYKKVVVLPHSTGVIYFLHFLKWVETPPPMGGGGGGSGWCAKYIKAIMNISPTFLGVPKAVRNIFSSEGKDVTFLRAMAPGFLGLTYLGLLTLEHVKLVHRTWDSVISLMSKGGEIIWGNKDWSPDEGNKCDHLKGYVKPLVSSNSHNNSDGKKGFQVKEPMKESFRKVSEKKVYTAESVFDLLRFVAPEMMKRAGTHFSHGIAEDLDDPKYVHYKYWSNPLETRLPNAPGLEIYCLYGVETPTERSYVYKLLAPHMCKSIHCQIDSSVDGEEGSCLKHGVHFVDGDESVPVVSAGFMCAKGWRGRTRFNPSSMAMYAREYQHKLPASLLGGRGLGSGAHVDIMGNVALIEDVLKVVGGATGEEIGVDRIFSDILRMSERINLKL